MYKILSFAVALLLGLVTAQQVPPQPTANTDHWAVLVAGSNGFWNYRH